jgi:molecular chaperone GrpE
MAEDKNSQDGSNPKDGDMKRLSDETDPGFDASQAKTSQEAGAKAPAETVEELTEQLAKVRSEYLYLYAEFENYKKNAIKERVDLRKYGSERLVVDLLNVLDIFETALALDPTPENMQAFRKGIEMTATELKATLQRNGIEELPGLGTPFNPSHHEALSSEESADLPPGHVSRVFKKPYKLHERVVRPGQVVVAKAKG